MQNQAQQQIATAQQQSHLLNQQMSMNFHQTSLDFQRQSREMQSQAEAMQNQAQQQMAAARQNSNALNQQLTMNFSQMQLDFQRQSRNMQSQAAAMRRHAQHMQRQARAQAAQAQAQASDGMFQSYPSGGSMLSHLGGVSTQMQNGNLYVNGELVHQGSPGDPLNVSNVNGVVYVNNVQVWPRAASSEGSIVAMQTNLEAAGNVLGTRDEEARVQEQLQLLHMHSNRYETPVELDGDCAICMEPRGPGQTLRTLPCFHVFHDSCVTAFFETPQTEPLSCPVCRTDLRAGSQ